MSELSTVELKDFQRPTRTLSGPRCPVKNWRPHALPQQETTDCGVAAVAALAAMYGHQVCGNELRKLVGSTARGLTMRNLRDLLRRAGFGAEVVRIDDRNGGAADLSPAIGLWRKKHFVVLGKIGTSVQHVFDPGCGWRRIRRAELYAELSTLAVVVTSVPSFPLVAVRSRFPLVSWLRLFPVRTLATWVCVTTVLAQAFGIGLPWLTGKIVDQATASALQASSASSATLMLYAAAAGFALMSRAVTSELTARLKQLLTTQITADITGRVFAKPIEYLRRHVPDILGARILGSVQLQELVSDDLPTVLVNTGILVSALVMMSLVSPLLAALSVIGVSLKACIDYWVRPLSLETQEREFWCRVRHQSLLLDSLRCIHSMRQYRAIPSVLAQLDKECQSNARAAYERGRISRAQQAVYGLIDVADRTAFIVIGAALIGGAGVTAGAFLAVTLYRETLIGALDTFRSMHSRFISTQSAAGRLEDVVTRQTLVTAPRQEVRGTLSHGAVCVENVSFRYSCFTNPVISNLSLQIRDGETVAIVAPSGSGKSTLAKLLCGALSPTDGRIYIGGIDLSSQEAEVAMRGVGIVMQDDVLMAGSIRDNIAMFRGMSDDQVVNAAKVVELHDWIASLPMRYETEVSDAVLTVSGGQRQRLLLARAICGGVKVLVMDEATSHLDVATERIILDRISAMGITTITFAHRPETIKRADRVVRLDISADTSATGQIS